MHQRVMITLAFVGLLGLLSQWLAWRLKLPAILFLLIAGIVIGPVTGLLDPQAVFGEFLMPMISLSVAVILFEGSLTLKLREIMGLHRVVRHLVSIGVLVTWVLIALATHWLVDFSWKLSFLFGAITVVTGPTVIVPLLRTVRPNANVANILRWEGIVIDPIGALLGVLVFQFIISEADGAAVGQTLAAFCKSIIFSSSIGCIAGYGFGQIIRRHWLPEYLHNYAALSLVFGVFVSSNLIQHESGLMAVTVMGFWLANMKGVPMEDILNFKESLSILLISGLFIILAAGINFTRFDELGWGAVGIFCVIQFIVRPIKVFISTWGSSLNWRERLLIAWIAPRGIVAAAIAAAFAVRLQEQGFEALTMADPEVHMALTNREYLQAELLVPLAFMVIIGTVVLQSTTARFIALRLGIAEPEPRGFLIVGANALARAISIALKECGFNVLVADIDWEDVRAARMEGLDTYYGNVVSDHADHYLDLIGIGYMLALSEYPEINQLACQRYRSEFGRCSVYSVQAEHQPPTVTKSRFSSSPEGRLLFASGTGIHRLIEMLKDGAKIHKTVLTEQHDFQAFLESHQEDTVLLFTVDPKGSIHFFDKDQKISPRTNWLVASLVPSESLPVSQTFAPGPPSRAEK